jgi:hypothetical protein
VAGDDGFVVVVSRVGLAVDVDAATSVEVVVSEGASVAAP